MEFIINQEYIHTFIRIHLQIIHFRRLNIHKQCDTFLNIQTGPIKIPILLNWKHRHFMNF